MRMTPKRAEIVRALKGTGAYMLARLASDVPAARRGTVLTGTKVIQLVDDQELEVVDAPRISGVAAAGLIEAGYLVELDGKRRPFKGLIYELSASGNALDLPLVSQPSGWDAEQGVRIFRRDVEVMAAEFGAKIALNTTRHWWELVWSNPTRIVTITNEQEQPVARLNELSLSQWRTAISTAAAMKLL